MCDNVIDSLCCVPLQTPVTVPQSHTTVLLLQNDTQRCQTQGPVHVSPERFKKFIRRHQEGTCEIQSALATCVYVRRNVNSQLTFK